MILLCRTSPKCHYAVLYLYIFKIADITGSSNISTFWTLSRATENVLMWVYTPTVQEDWRQLHQAVMQLWWRIVFYTTVLRRRLEHSLNKWAPTPHHRNEASAAKVYFVSLWPWSLSSELENLFRWHVDNLCQVLLESFHSYISRQASIGTITVDLGWPWPLLVQGH